ncbi:hypothetical protein [Methanolobus halotolerans]|uniref:N-acetyltransferase domain-containing protein n=1 Tax=Methanolobus halotolerans TaxID=2052935 RepID=A0A4E0QR29_9EURY|nr:hypothetical protein [Methanolobus halotolerans]TGC08681.1 hypothetical protein CUN85_08370 [Methanolobus halotolerans]
MIELAKTSDGLSFCVPEYPFELDKLKIGEFIYFKKHLGMTNYMANFKSWLKRPAVVLVLVLSGNTVVGWSMNEKWNSPSTDGKPVYVLRAIEISPQFARKGLGKNIFYLISSVLTGHIITKPVNKAAKIFFESLYFAEPSSGSTVHLSDHPGYFILEDGKKELLSCEGISLFGENIRSCRLKIFPKGIVPGGIREYVGPSESKGLSSLDNEVTVEKKTDISDSCNDGSKADQGPIVFDGKYIGEQKMMSPCKCGHYVVYKYQVAGKKKGIAFICAECNTARYFLPLKS